MHAGAGCADPRASGRREPAPLFRVMAGPRRRSTGVTATATAPSPMPSSGRGGLDFDALYRAARDDVYAYVMTLVRDRGAAEDVTAAAFERAYRKQGTFRADRGSD